MQISFSIGLWNASDGWQRSARQCTLWPEAREVPPSGCGPGRRNSGRHRMSAGWVRAIVALIVFAVALIVGVNVTGSLDLTPDENTGVVAASNTFIALFSVALVLAFIAYAATEYAQTKRLESITRQFDTRTIVLIPIAIAINIILGQTVAAASRSRSISTRSERSSSASWPVPLPER